MAFLIQGLYAGSDSSITTTTVTVLGDVSKLARCLWLPAVTSGCSCLIAFLVSLQN